MVLTLELTENPDTVPLEELQGIYRYATKDEYEEVLKCSKELELISCALFIASYAPKEVATATMVPPADPVNMPESSAERGSQEWVRQVEAKVHLLVNQERQKAKVRSLANDARLTDVARAHSQDMATNDFYSHIDLKGQDPTDRAKAANYSCTKDLGGGWYTDGIAENIVQGWTYSSTTYIGLMPIRNYMTADQLANQL
jgi:hypothetical protein